MKTIFIIAGGIADLPDPELEGSTPLGIAETPSLDALAKCGCCGSLLAVDEEVPLTTANAILSLLGYDFSRGVPDPMELEEFGATDERVAPAYDEPGRESTLRYFVVSKFSGHGVVISAMDFVKGIGKMALLSPLEVEGATGDLDSDLRAKAEAAIAAIEGHEFVLLHIDAAERRGRMGDLKGKIEAIERIDRDVINPIADYVWNAKVQMNMVVVSDHITSWRMGRPVRGEVPAVVYFNDDLPYDTQSFDEASVVDGPLGTPLPGDLIKKLITFEPYVEDPKEGAIGI